MGKQDSFRPLVEVDGKKLPNLHKEPKFRRFCWRQKKKKKARSIKIAPFFGFSAKFPDPRKWNFPENCAHPVSFGALKQTTTKRKRAETMGKDYYAILGVSRGADEAALKKAYRTQCRKWHPDKNGDNLKVAEEKFKEIAEAYDVLSNPEKKKIYDQFGEEGLKGGIPAGGGGGGGGGPGMGPGYSYTFTSGADQEELLKNLFGDGGNPFSAFLGGMGGGRGGGASFRTSSQPGFGGSFGGSSFGGGDFGGGSSFGGQKPKDVVHYVNVELEDLFHGTTKSLKITQRKINPATNGYTEVPEVITLNIKPGWKEGTKVTYEGRGNESPGVPPADVVFVIKQKPHPNFTRDGDDLVYRATITLEEALTGTKVDVRTLDNRHLRVNIREVVHPNYSKVLQGEGMPNSKTGKRGNLRIQFSVMWPTELREDQKEMMRKAFM